MIIYLVKMTHRPSGRWGVKPGHTKGKVKDRFAGPEYDDFDIELISHIYLTCSNFLIAKAVTECCEELMRAIIPAKDPSFMIEEYFGVEPGTLKISGVTEMTFPQTRDEYDTIIDNFEKFKSQGFRINRILEKY